MDYTLYFTFLPLFNLPPFILTHPNPTMSPSPPPPPPPSSFSFLSLFFFTTLLLSSSPSNADTLQIIHSKTISPTSWKTQLSNDQARLSYLSSLALAKRAFVPIASGTKILQTPTYVVKASIGTPPQPMLVAIDTSSDASWIPSSTCTGCPQSTNTYNPALSTTYKPVPCGSVQCQQVQNPSCPARSTSCFFNFTYGSSSISASLTQDSLSLSSEVVKSYTFGSIVTAAGSSVLPQGLLGLGRGPLSFLSQTKDVYSSTFSYCLPGFRSANFSGTLRLGPIGQPVVIKTTPLLSNPRRSSLYYVNLVRIRVGKRWIAVGNGFDATTGSGTVLDSGTMFTRLVNPVYVAVRDEFRRRVGKPVTTLGGFDTCYSGAVTVPAVTFEFVGMNMTLTVENVMIRSSGSDLSCLAMAGAPENVNSVLNVIGSMQQMNHRVLFDGKNGKVGIARETCTTT